MHLFYVIGQPNFQKNMVSDKSLLYSSTYNFSKTILQNLSRSHSRTGIFRKFTSVDMRHTLFIALVHPLLEIPLS